MVDKQFISRFPYCDFLTIIIFPNIHQNFPTTRIKNICLTLAILSKQEVTALPSSRHPPPLQYQFFLSQLPTYRQSEGWRFCRLPFWLTVPPLQMGQRGLSCNSPFGWDGATRSGRPRMSSAAAAAAATGPLSAAVRNNYAISASAAAAQPRL